MYLPVTDIALMLCLQLFAASGLETADFANMEGLSNHMGLFLQVTLTNVWRSVTVVKTVRTMYASQSWAHVQQSTGAREMHQLDCKSLCHFAVSDI